jgi:hypothetical protein
MIKNRKILNPLWLLLIITVYTGIKLNLNPSMNLIILFIVFVIMNILGFIYRYKILNGKRQKA